MTDSTGQMAPPPTGSDVPSVNPDDVVDRARGWASNDQGWQNSGFGLRAAQDLIGEGIPALAAKLAQVEAELAKWKSYRLCKRHDPGPDDNDYGNDGCVLCLLNRSEIAQAALATVRELHQPDMTWVQEHRRDDPELRARAACKGCRAPGVGGFAFGQCPTTRALDAARVPHREPTVTLDGADVRYVRQHLSNCRTRHGGRCGQNCRERLDPDTGQLLPEGTNSDE